VKPTPRVKVIVPRAHTTSTLYVRARLALGSAGASPQELTSFEEQVRAAPDVHARRQVIAEWVDVLTCQNCRTSCEKPSTCAVPASTEAWRGLPPN
jgi:hypothetical protein